MADQIHHRFLIIGGGTAGIAVAAHLRRAGQTDVAIIEPSLIHYYQPMWTLVGAGVVEREVTARQEGDYLPPGADWIRERAAEIDPERRRVTTESGTQVSYDFLIVATGVELNWDAIPGLREAMGSSASTNYDYDLAPQTWRMIQGFRGGTALFHMPGTPVKCPGAPQKIMYLAADYFRRHNISANVIYGAGGAAIYGVKEYAAVLSKVVERYGIDTRFKHEMVRVNPQKKEAVFRNGGAGREVTIPYDILHAVPPQRPAEFVRKSPLADSSTGWVKVDKYTLQNPDYPNVFALGDVAGTPNAKTGAAAYRQSMVVAANIVSTANGGEPVRFYDGYIACPIVTGYGRLLLCETDYDGKPRPTIPFIDTMKERYSMWLLKRYALPWLYWNVVLRGRTIPFLYGTREMAHSPAAAEAPAGARI